MELVLATQNLGKLNEFRAAFKAYPQFDLLSLRSFPKYTPPEEEGVSFEEIAKVKALDACRLLGKWVLADDSGLVVPALGGAPGIRSRRYAGPCATDSENKRRLLSEMDGFQSDQRAAYYTCALCLASPIGVTYAATGYSEGEILIEERGSGGFGYDSLFLHGCGKTFAELSEHVRNAISHRGKALEKLFHILLRLDLSKEPLVAL